VLLDPAFSIPTLSRPALEGFLTLPAPVASIEESSQQVFECFAASNLITWFWPNCSRPQMRFAGVMMKPLGYCPGDLESDYATFVGLMHPEDVALLEEPFARCLAAGQVGEYEARIRMRRKDGQYANVRATMSLVRARQGAPLAAFGIIRVLDLEREREYAALKLTQDALHSVLNRIGHGVVLLTAEGVVVQANEAAAAVAGCSAADLVGSTRSPFLYALDGSPVAPGFLRAVVLSRQEYECELLSNERWWHVHLVPLSRSGESIERVLLLAEDITEKKAEQNAQLARQKSLTDALVREVHHRIKNHLQGLVGLLRTYADTKMSASSVIDGAVTRILSIATVHGLLTRDGEGSIELAELVTQIVATLGVNSPIPLQFSVDDTAWHATQLVQQEAVPLAIAIAELFTNAIKHTRPLPNAHVQGRLHTLGDGVELTITNGPATLPESFDLKARRPASAGLELVQTLLAPGRSILHLVQDDTDVVARLRFIPRKPDKG
jgi:PAS domain S-box-containing protein